MDSGVDAVIRCSRRGPTIPWPTMNKVGIIAAVVAAVVGGGLFWLYMVRFENEITGGEFVEVLVAERDVELDEPLTEKMLGVTRLPSLYVERHVRRSDLSRILGQRLSNPVKGGQSLLWTDLRASADESRDLASNVRRGMRAFTIPARSGASFGGLLRPGDRVDVLYTAERPGAGEKVTLPLLQNLLVLAIGSDLGDSVYNNDKTRGRSRDVTVLADLKQATLLAHSLDGGDLRLTLRNQDDVEIREGVPDTTNEDLIEAERRIRRQRDVRHSKPSIEKVN